LSCLPHAGGLNGSRIALRVKARIAPIETTEIDHPPRNLLAISDERLIIDLQKYRSRFGGNE
jgi:hypothetical protein